MKKSRLLLIIAILIVGQYVFAAQSWFNIAMSTDAKPTSLGQFDGFTSFAAINPLLSVQILAFLFVSLSQATSRVVFAVLGGFAATGVTFVATLGWLSKNTSGLNSQLEKLTGIAITHGVDLTVTGQSAALVFVLFSGFAAVGFWAVLLLHRKWPIKTAKYEKFQTVDSTSPADKAGGTRATRSGISKANDPISLWDSQR